jgi:MFS family permease
VTAPIIELKLFLNRVFSSGVTAQLFVQIAHGGWNFLAPFYLIQGLGFSASFAGLLILPFHLVRLILSPISGAISDKMGTLLPSLLGKILLLGGLLALSRLGFDAPSWQIALVIGVAGAGLSIFLPPNNSAIMGYVPQSRLSSASGVLATSRSIGVSIGTALAAAAYASSLGGAGLPLPGIASPAVIAAFRDGMLVVTLTSALGILAILWRGRD